MERPSPALFETREAVVAHLGAMRRIKGWTRERFTLDAVATVLIEQAQSGLPGFPPVETVIAFWTSPEVRHEFRIFKSAAEIEEADLPPSWMKDALRVEIEMGCGCC